MATVRLSQNLREEIYRKAANAFEAAHPEPSLNDEDTKFLTDALINAPAQVEARELREKIKVFSGKYNRSFGFCDATAFCAAEIERVRIECPTTYEGCQNASVTLSVDLTNEVELLTGGYYSRYSSSISVSALDASHQSRVTHFIDELYAAREAHKLKSKQYHDQIMALLNRCTTLKQLVSAWPQIKTFVPEEALQKMEEKVERTAPKSIAEEVEFDTSLATSVAVTAKLKGVV